MSRRFGQIYPFCQKLLFKHSCCTKTDKQKIERTYLENKLNFLENSPNFGNNPEYIETYEKLDKIYQEKTNGIRNRSKCNWFEHGEKSSKFFLNLEKSCAVQNQIRNVLI